MSTVLQWKRISSHCIKNNTTTARDYDWNKIKSSCTLVISLLDDRVVVVLAHMKFSFRSFGTKEHRLLRSEDITSVTRIVSDNGAKAREICCKQRSLCESGGIKECKRCEKEEVVQGKGKHNLIRFALGSSSILGLLRYRHDSNSHNFRSVLPAVCAWKRTV